MTFRSFFFRLGGVEMRDLIVDWKENSESSSRKDFFRPRLGLPFGDFEPEGDSAFFVHLESLVILVSSSISV